MSDNRNFVNKFANQGGGDIYVEDAKLSEISTKTAIASEGVMLKGTDGAYYEIDKASLSEVVRAELGAILADNSHDNGTSVAKVPTLNSTDNVLGSSSIANLASVLGVEQVNIGAVTQGQTINIPFRDFVGCVHISARTSGIWAVVVFDSAGVTVIQKGSRCDSFLSFSVSAPGNSPSAWNLVVSVLDNISTGIYYKRL